MAARLRLTTWPLVVLSALLLAGCTTASTAKSSPRTTAISPAHASTQSSTTTRSPGAVLEGWPAGALTEQLLRMIQQRFGEPLTGFIAPQENELLIEAPGTSFGMATSRQPAGGAGVLVLDCGRQACLDRTLPSRSLKRWVFYAAPLGGYLGTMAEYPPASYPAGTLQIGATSTFYNYVDHTYRCGISLIVCHVGAAYLQRIRSSVLHLESLVRVVLPAT